MEGNGNIFRQIIYQGKSGNKWKSEIETKEGIRFMYFFYGQNLGFSKSFRVTYPEPET